MRFLALLLLCMSGLPVQEAWAVWGTGGATCTAQSKAAGTTLACTVATEAMEAGNVAVLWFAGDNVATTDVTTLLLTSVTDSVGGNTWTVRQCFTNGQGTAATGATTCVATSVLTNALAIGSTITANFTSITAKAIVVREFTIGPGRTIAVAGTPQTLSNDNADPGAMTISGLESGQRLFVRSTGLERASGGTWTVTAGYTTSNCNGTTGAPPASNMEVCGEFRILTGTSSTSNPTGTAVDNASVFIAFEEVPKTVIADGTNPSNVTIAPSAAITDLDAFTLTTSTGTDSVTALTVTLTGANSFESLSEVRITSNDDATTYFSAVANPASNTVSFSGGTPIPVTTTTTTFKVRITPKTHANMPVPPGLSYAVGGTVTAFTSTNAQYGTDSASATVTVDNLSPANVTAASCTAGDGQVSLNWTNPADPDFHSTVVLRNTVAVADTPVEGTTYVVGNTIGASTVACVVATPTATCTDTGLTNGTAYHYRIFARDTNVNYSATGVAPSGSPCTPTPVASFNVVQPAANPVTGKIFTKIAGQDIAVDIVALDASSAIVTGFTGTVAVELVNDTGVACASLPLIKALTDQTFVGGDSGRHPLSAGQFEANAWPNVKFRIKYPTASPTITSCSSDAFANRPKEFVNLLVRDLNRTTAGTTNTLNNTSNPGTGTVHNAGRPFQIDATAQNGAGTPATTTLYTADLGQPVAVLSQCGVAAVCPASPGAVTTGTFSASSGVITSTTATYNDVGAFDLVLQDQTFSAIDIGDGTSTSVRYISNAPAVTVGRFVPDYFTLEAGSTITPRSDIVACAGSTFTYMSERMDLVFTLRAREFSGGAVTPNYAGATLGALALNSAASYSFGAIDSAAPTLLTARLDLSLIPGATGAWAAGSASVTAPLAITRNATPDGPYALFKIGIAPSDPDTVALRAADLNLDADNSGTPERVQVGAITPIAVRFGRLRMQNASGSEKIDLVIPLQAQYWTGTGFATNAADGCTSLSAANLAFSAYTGGVGGISAANMNAANISLGGAFVLGLGNLKLIKPTTPVPTIPGSATLTIDLGLTGESKTYLQGNWGVPTYTANPSARAGFGLYGAQPRNFIFFRENY